MNKQAKVSKKEVMKMARFFLKELFDGIPTIDIEIKEPHCYGGNALGMFSLEANDEYDESIDSELVNELYEEYKGHIELDFGYGITAGYNGGELPWLDVLSHPKIKILIKPSVCRDRHQLVMTLLHELCHYYCWYLGYGYHDTDRDFLDTCKKLGIETNYDFKWNGHEWTRPEYYRRSAENYLRMYESEVAA